MSLHEAPVAERRSLWDLAAHTAAALAIAPAAMPGLRLRAAPGPVRDAWLAGFASLLPPGTPLRRMPATIADARLLGGLDLAASLASGRPIAEHGLLAECDGGVVIAAMAERLSAATAARLAAVQDAGAVLAERDGLTLRHTARFGLIALDEGIEGEAPPAALLDRLAIVVGLDALSHNDIGPLAFDRTAIEEAETRLGAVVAGETVIEALCAAAQMLGIASLRAPIQAIEIARRLAALAGKPEVGEAEAALAAELVLAPRATRLPQPAAAEAQPPAPEPPPESMPDDTPPPGEMPEESPGEPPTLEDIVLDAAKAAIPAGLLALLQNGVKAPAARGSGRAGLVQKAAKRGRIIGVRAGDPGGSARLDVVETLRAAAPWQRLRRREGTGQRSGPLVRREDFRLARFRNRGETTTIFVVDTSGSSALQRLAEAKGAVRLLLAECYVRRDEVALIAFRGKAAELVLPPTRALARAQRALAAMPGGGGTPIAAGIDAAANLADQVRRAGRTPHIVLMTDGRANIALDGGAGRARAQDDARAAARRLAARGLSVVLIDTSPRPQPLATELAGALGARAVHLPYADARRVAQAIGQLTPGRVA